MKLISANLLPYFNELWSSYVINFILDRNNHSSQPYYLSGNMLSRRKLISLRCQPRSDIRTLKFKVFYKCAFQWSSGILHSLHMWTKANKKTPNREGKEHAYVFFMFCNFLLRPMADVQWQSSHDELKHDILRTCTNTSGIDTRHLHHTLIDFHFPLLTRIIDPSTEADTSGFTVCTSFS